VVLARRGAANAAARDLAPEAGESAAAESAAAR